MGEGEGLDRIDEFDAQLDALGRTLGATSSIAAGFDAELQQMRRAMAATGQDMKTLERGLSSGLRRAFDGVVFDGMKLSDALGVVGRSLMNTAYSAAVRPVASHFGTLVAQSLGSAVSGVMPFAQGAGFAQGRVMPFAAGGVVTGPTRFPMRGGATGLMGEAGPEAIMPLARGADGRLGVRSAGGGGGGGVNVVMNISTPDVQGFRRSQGQIAAEMGRVLSRGQRNR